MRCEGSLCMLENDDSWVTGENRICVEVKKSGNDGK